MMPDGRMADLGVGRRIDPVTGERIDPVSTFRRTARSPVFPTADRTVTLSEFSAPTGI